MDNSQNPDAQLLAFIAAAIDDGLPLFEQIYMYSSQSMKGIDLQFNSHDSIGPWAERFGVTDLDRQHGAGQQPYPLEEPYELWTTRQHVSWEGWTVYLKSQEPITDENRRWWIDSGKAAERAEYVAQQKAAEGEGTR